jgi:hypothetical protein
LEGNLDLRVLLEIYATPCACARALLAYLISLFPHFRFGGFDLFWSFLGTGMPEDVFSVVSDVDGGTTRSGVGVALDQ